jgi:hypothetical protein
MAWTPFPYPDRRFVYTASALKKAWPGLHAGDAEPFPGAPAVTSAWIAFHAGQFEDAVHKGLAAGLAGQAAANKAACIHAVYLEPSADTRQARLMEVAERCAHQQARERSNPAGFYWHAYALGRYAQSLGVAAALAQGVAPKVRASLETTLELEPHHADAHIALGAYHAEIVARLGALVGRLTYGATREHSLKHFQTALQLNNHSAIARVEYANALIMLDGLSGETQAAALRAQAAALEPQDAMEKLDIERARHELAAS